MLGQVLEGYGVPVSLERRLRLGHTRLGAGVLAGARAALPGGTAADLLTWLRTPGRLADPGTADALDVHVRRAELDTAREARAALRRILEERPPAAAARSARPLGDPLAPRAPCHDPPPRAPLDDRAARR